MVLYIQMLAMKFDKDIAGPHWLAFAKVSRKQEWKLFPMKQNVYLFLMSFYIWKLPQCTLIRLSLTCKYFSSLRQHKSKDFRILLCQGQED